jgi:hypothetical protein
MKNAMIRGFFMGERIIGEPMLEEPQKHKCFHRRVHRRRRADAGRTTKTQMFS